MHKYLWRKVSHHDTDTFIKFHFKKSKDPKNNGSIQVLHKLELPTHILHSRGFSAVQLTKSWEKKTFLRQNHLIIVIRAHKKSPQTKRCTAYKHCTEKEKIFRDKTSFSLFTLYYWIQRGKRKLFSVFSILGFVKRLSLEHWN